MRRLALASLVVGAAACNANDPEYMQCTPAAMQPMCLSDLEAGMDDGMGGLTSAKSQLLLPIDPEKPADATARMALQTKLGVMVPYVKVGDIEVSVEWTIKNLDGMDGTAFVALDGATEFFEYDPTMIVLSNDREAPPTPDLSGTNVPIHVAANGTVSGLFSEDDLREASIDIEQVTRANINPFKATLTINKNDKSIAPLLPFDPTMPDLPPQPDPNAIAIPREAFANIVRVDLVFKADRHMVLEYSVRVRDIRGDMLNNLLMNAPQNKLYMFNIQPFAVMVAPGA